jgi:heme-degrading monooxygenase HmoA
MAVIVVTRLRLRDPGVLNDFFAAASASLEQAQKSPGNLASDALAEANDTWWTITSWQDRATMRAFVAAEPHHSVMGRLSDWCDEAAFVDWEQPDPALPDWQTGYRHLIADGQAADLPQASPANRALGYPPPVVPAP